MQRKPASVWPVAKVHVERHLVARSDYGRFASPNNVLEAGQEHRTLVGWGCRFAALVMCGPSSALVRMSRRKTDISLVATTTMKKNQTRESRLQIRTRMLPQDVGRSPGPPRSVHLGKGGINNNNKYATVEADTASHENHGTTLRLPLSAASRDRPGARSRQR